MFSIMAVSSFSSGAMVSAAGWEVMNVAALPILVFIAAVVIWYARHRGRRAPKTA
jgi:hypothetical protein